MDGTGPEGKGPMTGRRAGRCRKGQAEEESIRSGRGQGKGRKSGAGQGRGRNAGRGSADGSR